MNKVVDGAANKMQTAEVQTTAVVVLVVDDDGDHDGGVVDDGVVVVVVVDNDDRNAWGIDWIEIESVRGHVQQRKNANAGGGTKGDEMGSR